MIVPVPMHKARQADRGYNQAELLAKAVAFHWQSPLRTDLLFRTKEIGSQTKRSAAQRREAISRVFVASPLAYGKRILLVDDVLTTGATASACAQALLDAGAAEVILLTVCQA
jgi:ComF family protein